MNERKLKKLREQLELLRQSPTGLKARDFVSIAGKVGRVRDSRGKEPTYVRKENPALSPPLSIPNHAKELKKGTAISIIDALLSDLDDWSIHLLKLNDVEKKTK